MKLHQLILAILITGLFGCQGKKNEVTIIGKINGDILDKIEYTVPINGVCNYAFKEAVLTDSLGNFTITMNIEKPSFVKIFIPGKAYGTLIVEAGINYDVNFNLESKENTFIVICDNQKGQDAYNLLPNPDHIQSAAREFTKDSVASVIKLKLKSLKDNEIALFDELLSNKDISEEFFQLVKLDRECYYSAVQVTVALLKHFEDSRKNNGVFTSEIEKMLEETFAEVSPTTNFLISSPWYYSLAENFIKYNEYPDNPTDIEKLKEFFKNGFRHTHHIKESKKHLTSNMLEYYDATYLFNKCLQKKYEKELISLFEEFKTDFPNSEYTRYLKPMVSPIVEFHKKKEKPFNENIKFINGYEGINLLKKSVSSMKGKKVYVDVWATWCGPCKAEFEHKEELKKLLLSKNIKILYISIDKEDKSKQWKDMIKFYNLEGYHIRANQKLNEDLRKIFNRNGSISIPWYILIDENGDIIKEHAKRPSQIEELEKQIDESFNMVKK